MRRPGVPHQMEFPGPLVVRSEADLGRVLQRKELLHPFRKPRVFLRNSGLSELETRAWEQQLENLRQECGCTEGALALVAFMVLYGLYVLKAGLLGPDVHRPGAAGLAVGFLVGGLILSPLVGKLVGLALAEARYRRTCGKLGERLRSIQPQPAVMSGQYVSSAGTT